MAYLLEGMDKRPVDEVSQEELVATSDGRSDVTEGHSGTVHLCVGELAACRNNDPDDV